MDLDKLIQNYEDIIEISKQTTADLEKTLALLKSQKLNQEKELSLNVTESIAYEDPRVQEQRDLALQNGYSKEDADEVAASYHYYYSRLDEIERDVIAEGKPANGADYELRAEEARKNLNQDLNLIDYKYEAAKDAPVQNVSQAKRPLKRPRKTMSKI